MSDPSETDRSETDPSETDRSETNLCENVLDTLEDYIDGEFDDHRKSVVTAHLEGCPTCAAEHRLAIAVQSGLRQLPEVDAPAAILQELLQQAEPRPAKLLSWRSRSLSESYGDARHPKTPRRVMLAAAVLAIAMLGWGLLLDWGPVFGPESASKALPNLASQPSIPDQAKIAQATEEARFALAYLSRVSRRTGLELKQDLLADHLVRPAARGLARSLSAGGRARDATRERNRS